MRLPDFTAEVSLYKASDAYHAMEAAELAQGREVLPSVVGPRCVVCPGPFPIEYRCCCPPNRFPICGPFFSGRCFCVT